MGGSGTVAGVIANEGNEGNEFPILFVAITVNVYAVPIVNPVIKPVVEEVVSVIPSGDDTIVYEIIGEPPLLLGAFQLILAVPIVAPKLAVTFNGRVGTVGGAIFTN